LPADRQLYPRPGAAETGAHLSRQERRWGGLRIAAVSLATGPAQLANVEHGRWIALRATGFIEDPC
jgi:hypothetical protein